ncbi:MAG: AAA domain-containing protein, partial [Burkholderiales bacterium]
MADINAIMDLSDCQSPVSGYISGKALDRKEARFQPPPEDDRFLVFDADFSQESTVWKARSKPGLVVHGPPGTGKSQTIVNIIADALAHELTVLMVCQKQAATRVVLERLRKVDLADLCMEVHDPEQERKAVFQAIVDQVAALPKFQPITKTQEQRQRLAGQIEALKREL